MEGLRYVEFPSVLKVESKIFGVYESHELLVVLFISLIPVLLLPKESGLLAAGIMFVTITIIKLLTPELNPVYLFSALTFLGGKKQIYAAEEHDYSITDIRAEDWYLESDESYIAVLEVNPVNLFYALPDEQRNIIDSYKTLINQLDFPIQIICISVAIDLDRYLLSILRRAQDEDIASNSVMREVLLDYTRWFEYQIRNMNVVQRKYYVITSIAKKSKDLDLTELRRRIEIIASGLRRGGMSASILGRNEILQIYDLINQRKVLPLNLKSTADFPQTRGTVETLTSAEG